MCSSDLAFVGAVSFDGIDVPIEADKFPSGAAHAFGRFNGAHRHATGEFELSFTADAGVRYNVQFSTNLVDWADLDTVASDTGEVQVLDPAAMNSAIRYYRAVPVE